MDNINNDDISSLPGNTDFVKYINFFNMMKIKYEVNFHEELHTNSIGEKFVNFIINGKEISDYWEIKLEDYLLDENNARLSLLFTPDQEFFGALV